MKGHFAITHFPVRIAIDRVPPGLPLVSGMTAVHLTETAS
jgi:hypothetical protein